MVSLPLETLLVLSLSDGAALTGNSGFCPKKYKTTIFIFFPLFLHMNKSVIVIESGKRHRQYFKDLWNYRELFLFLTWRDFLVRYKQTIVGVAWSIIRPFITMVVFSVIFGKIAKLPSEGVPYPILVFAGLLPWQFFSRTVASGGTSLLSNNNLITKVYFPRIIIPTTPMLVSLVDLLISSAILVGIMVWYRYIPGVSICFLPGLLLIAVLFALGLSFFFSALNVKYRDFISILGYLLQLGLYISPVGYISNVIPEKWRLVYSLNPMVGVIDGFRWAITGKADFVYWPGLLLSAIMSVVIFVIGFMAFRKMEREFADFI